MPRRIAEYSASDGWTTLNRISTLGAYLLFVSVVVMLVNFYVSWRKPVPASANPWDGATLEWATSSPPPHHNFFSIPPIRTERPVWDANHPEHTTQILDRARVQPPHRAVEETLVASSDERE